MEPAEISASQDIKGLFCYNKYIMTKGEKMDKKSTSIEAVRHSLSHILAAAVLDMFPEAKLGIGPSIENGFYYDFDLPRTLIPEDLKILEDKMRDLIKADLNFECRSNDKDKALSFFKKINQEYKTEMINEISDDEVTIYDIRDKKTGKVIFADLCAGPHIELTKELQNIAWRLDKIAGSYWRGSEKNPAMQRIYGLAFASKEELAKYDDFIKEAEKRDHRKLGETLDLFTFFKEAPGMPFWRDKGVVLWNNLIDWWKKEHKLAGYTEVKTPVVLDKALWEKSGHWDHYKDNMFFTKVDDRDFALKPMNCPGSMLLYKSRLYSYRDLPIRQAEIGMVHRHELAGVLHGLLRVTQIHQDDAHIFCLPNQVEDEVKAVIDLIDKMYKKLGLEYHLELSTRPEEKSIGSDEMWQKAETALKKAMDSKKIEYKLNPGDGAFYGPKIDFHIKDALNRTWQTATIQLDFAMPERFDLEYIAEDGSKQRPVMLHRVVFGSIERFIGILTEHFAGAFPLWLAPVQARVLPISDKHNDYAQKVKDELEKSGIRVEVDIRTESIGKKIREAEIQKIPYMLIVGDKEVKDNKVSIRKYGQGDQGQTDIEKIIKNILHK